MVALQRGPRVDLQLLGENLADTVDQAQGDDYATSEPTDITPPSIAVVWIDRVHNLEAQMATLLYHIQPWRQKSIAEDKDQIAKKVVQ